MKEKSFLLLGGDDRMAALADLMLAEGFDVAMIGFGKALPAGVRAAAEGDRFYGFVGPTPATRDQKNWNTPKSDVPLALCEDWPRRCSRAWYFGKPKGFDGTDLMQDEAFLLQNAALTAEGIVSVLLGRGGLALSDEKVLILGYGRIAKALSRMLQAMGTPVTVTLRKEKDRVLAKTLGQQYVEFSKAGAAFGDHSLVINTIPSLREDALQVPGAQIKAALYDAAPGSLKAALPEANVQDLPGIPGRHFPQSAAKAMFRALQNSMACDFDKEGGQWN